MNGNHSGAPMMDSSYLYDSGSWNDSGFWDESGSWIDSGFWDESGVIYDIKGGYGYSTVEVLNFNPELNTHLAFTVRFLLLWTSGNFTMPPRIGVYGACDDGHFFNPYSSGIFGDPDVYYETDHYEFVRAKISDVRLDTIGQQYVIKGRTWVQYNYYPFGKARNEHDTYIQEDDITFKIPGEYIKEEEETD